MNKRVKLVHGVGVNDACYLVAQRVGGKYEMCPFYEKWKGMLERCYSSKAHERRPSYSSCYVVDDWHNFMTFKVWMETQDWEGKQLDKDLLVEGNNGYGPETCLFVDRQVNQFMTEKSANRGTYLLGVCASKNGKKFTAQIQTLGSGNLYLGTYETEELAHHAYKAKKAELAKELALTQADVRVSEALIKRYLGEDK